MKVKRILGILIILVICVTACFSIPSSATLYRTSGTISTNGAKKLNSVASKWLSGISKDMTTYEKALYAYLKLIKNCSYNNDEKESSTVYGAIVNGFAQCSGFADAYSYLLDELNIPNRMVHSDASDHAWNLVKMDNGKWYHCDPTNGKREAFLVGNNTLYSAWYGGSDFENWYNYDGKSKVKASNTDYKGPDGQITLTDGTKVMLHSCRDVTFVDGWFYYTVGKLYTEDEKKMYETEISGNSAYTILKRSHGGKEQTVLEPSKLLEKTKGHGLNNIGTICGDTIYFYYNGRIFRPTTCTVSTYNISTGKVDTYDVTVTQEQINLSGRSTSSGGKYTLISTVCHDSEVQDIAPTYSNYGTNGRTVCKKCGEVLMNGSRVKPLKIKAKPSVKYSTTKKGKVTVKFTNKYYKETSVNTQYKKSGGYQIQYRKNGTKKWTTKTVFSSKKSVTKMLKLKSKTKYEIRVRYATIVGDDDYFCPICQYGPWSKIKSIKVK